MNRFTVHCLLLGCTLMAYSSLVSAAGLSVSEQRTLFPQAKAALKQGNLKAYERLKARLKDYPLYPYLEIWEARWLLAKKDDDRSIPSILQQYADIPESADLRLAWIKHLARQKRWEVIADQMDHHPWLKRQLPNVSRVISWRRAKASEWLLEFSSYWASGGKIIDDMQDFERQWCQAGHPTREEIWSRIGVRLRQGKWKEADTLAASLPEKERHWLTSWKSMANRPQELIRWNPADIPDVSVARMMARDILHRLSRKDLPLAREALNHLLLLFDREESMRFARSLALRGARDHRPEARIWLKQIPSSYQTDETREWQVRLALIARDWEDVASMIARMPDHQARQARWMYWRAQALKMVGRHQQARQLLQSIADERGYYSFLAARELGKTYRFSPSPLSAAPGKLARLEANRAIKRAHEWWLLAETKKAEREWFHAMAQGFQDPEDWKAAAVLARQWGWDAMALRCAARAGAHDALAFRFPLAFASAVRKASRETGLSDSEIWSIIRQESAFDHAAVSRAGARGLMQLMPATARDLAYQLHWKGKPDLSDPETNIRLGSWYFGKLVHRFGRFEYAAAAYNAGPSRVTRWLQRLGQTDVHVWVEAIPFDETRRYVQQVMAFRIVYEWRKKQQLVNATEQRSKAGG